MAGWQRCDRCRRVLPAEEFDPGATTCRACLTVKVPTSPGRSSTVTRRQATPRPAAASSNGSTTGAPRSPLLGVRGSGDLEVRERRARRAAQDALAQSHPEEYALLLRDARLAEGLRPS